MVPKIAGQYVAKRLYDQILAPPAQRPETEEIEDATEDFDGQLVTDEDGQPVGTAHRLAEIAVYVVSDGYADLESELLRAVNERESRLLIRTEDGRIAALIYVPDPASAPRRVDGIRSDDI